MPSFLPRVTERHFRITLVVAAILHVIVFTLFAAGFEPKTIEIPFKPIHIKLGNRPNPSAGEAEINQEALKVAPTPVPRAPMLQASEPLPAPPTPAVEPVVAKPIAPPEVQNVAPIASDAPKIPTVQKEADNDGKQVQNTLPAPPVMPMPEQKPATPPPPVIAYQKPADIVQRFSETKPAATEDVPTGVQQFGATDSQAKADVSGSKLGNATLAEQQQISSYEQQLALWLQRHQVYPLSARRDGLEGRAVLRLQMDRMGNVRFMELAEKTGHPILDSAILSMVQRADPLPPVPESYPETSYIIEFLLPVSFTLTEAEKRQMDTIETQP